MGGSSTSTKHEESKNTIDPMQMQQYQQNYADAQQRIGSLTPYSGQITAGFNPNQIKAQGLLSNIASDPRYQAVNQNAADSVQGILGSNMNTSISADPYSAAQLAGTDLSPYMNPFQKNVIDASISQNQYARDQQGVADNAAATAAHAFGGSRQGVQRAETSAGYDRNNQQNIAALNSANFGQAQNAALSDISGRNAASQFNSSQNMTAQQQSVANSLAAQGLKLNAAGQLVSINNNGLSLAAQQGGILSAVGDAQQQQQQTELSNAYNAYLQGQQLTLTQQQMLNQALGIIPVQTNSVSDGTTTTKSNPGAMGILGGIANLGMGIASGGASLGLTGGLSGILGNSLKGQKSGPEFGWT